MKHWKIAIAMVLIAFVIIVALVSDFKYLPIKSCVDAYDVDRDGSLRLVNRAQLLSCKLTTTAIVGVAGLGIFSLVALIRRRKP